MILLLDNYDSFTYNLLDILAREKADCRVVRNDEMSIDELIGLKPSGILISPGPGRPSESGMLMETISYFYDKIPFLGICLGHQALAEHAGARLSHAIRPMHGKVSIITHLQHPMYHNIPQNTGMMRYHSLIVSDLPESLAATAHSENGEIMSFAHKSLPVWGVQYHPESVLSPYGPELIKNWLRNI